MLDERFTAIVGITCMTDAQAMAALSRGDIAALDVLVVRHNDRAQRLAFGVLRDPSITHDVVANSFLAAAAQLVRTIRPGRSNRGSIASW